MNSYHWTDCIVKCNKYKIIWKVTYLPFFFLNWNIKTSKHSMEVTLKCSITFLNNRILIVTMHSRLNLRRFLFFQKKIRSFVSKKVKPFVTICYYLKKLKPNPLIYSVLYIQIIQFFLFFLFILCNWDKEIYNWKFWVSVDKLWQMKFSHLNFI